MQHLQRCYWKDSKGGISLSLFCPSHFRFLSLPKKEVVDQKRMLRKWNTFSGLTKSYASCLNMKCEEFFSEVSNEVTSFSISSLI